MLQGADWLKKIGKAPLYSSVMACREIRCHESPRMSVLTLEAGSCH